jgi:hypothetical protein
MRLLVRRGAAAGNQQYSQAHLAASRIANLPRPGTRCWNAAAGRAFFRQATKELAMSHSHLPPVPPDSRTKIDSADGLRDTAKERDTSKSKGPPDNLAEQGRQGNIAQNTHNQGYQQDR